MEPKEQKIYDNFFEFWDNKYLNELEYVKQIALDAWDTAINGFFIGDFGDREFYEEAIKRGFKIEKL